MVFYLTINQVDSYHGCVCSLLTFDTKDILWIDDCVLIMTYKFLVMGRVGRSRSGPIFGTPFGPSLGLGLGPVSVHLGHGLVRS